VVTPAALAEKITTETQRTQSGPHPAGPPDSCREGFTRDLRTLPPGHGARADERRALCDLRVSVVTPATLTGKITTETRRTRSGPYPAGRPDSCRRVSTTEILVSPPGHGARADERRALCDLCVSVVTPPSPTVR